MIGTIFKFKYKFFDSHPVWRASRFAMIAPTKTPGLSDN
jgi:hypothetical protein